MYSASTSPLPSRGSDFPSFVVGDFRVHPSRNLLERGKEAIRLQPRIMHVLICLASRGGDVVSREELLDAVWRDAVVCEDSLTRAVSDLRRIFADDPSSAAIIETIRKVGYRLVLPVEILGTPPTGGVRGRASGWPRIIVAIIVLAVLIAAAGLVLRPEPAESGGPIAFLAGRPLTSTAANEFQPALAPDGSAVAFIWSGPDQDNLDVWIQENGEDPPRRLTDDPAPEKLPTWSPDGSRLAFIRVGDPEAIFTVDRDGTRPERVITLAGGSYGLDWSPDGERLVFASPLEADGPVRVQLLDLHSGETTVPVVDEADVFCDLRPAFSPDGRQLAFIRAGTFYQQDIFVMSLDGAQPRRLTNLQKRIRGLDWCADGRAIVFASAPNGLSQLRQVGLDGGVPIWLPTQSRCALSPTVALDTGHLAYVDVRFDSDIWRLRLDRIDDPEAGLEPVIVSTRNDFGAEYSPDGSRIVFISDRSGNREIWICDADGGGTRQLSDFGGPRVMRPHWSPDGERIVFTLDRDSFCDIGIIDAAGGEVRLLGQPDRHELALAWVGESIYFESIGAGCSIIWRMDQTGRGRNEVTTLGFRLVGATEEGVVYYCHAEEPGIWRLDADGTETCVVPGEESEAWIQATLAGRWIYHLRASEEGTGLGRFNLDTAETETLAVVTAGQGTRLCVSPDGGDVLYCRLEHYERDLVIVDEFH